MDSPSFRSVYEEEHINLEELELERGPGWVATAVGSFVLPRLV
jgi:hypothetical protein